MKVSELEGAKLDRWVAKAKWPGGESVDYSAKGQVVISLHHFGAVYSPSTDWSQGGPIIEREKIEIIYFGKDAMEGHEWEAQIGCDTHYIDQTVGEAMGGPTPLIAAMRCFVASKFGEEVTD